MLGFRTCDQRSKERVRERTSINATLLAADSLAHLRLAFARSKHRASPTRRSVICCSLVLGPLAQGATNNFARSRHGHLINESHDTRIFVRG